MVCALQVCNFASQQAKAVTSMVRNFSATIALLSLLAPFALLAVPNSAYGQTPEELIPFKKLKPELRKELWKVTKRPTVRRKVKEQTVKCKEATFHYLMRRLPLASRLVRHMKLGKYVIKKLENDGFSITDSEGAFANCEIVFQEANRIVIVARGYIETGIFPKVYGTGVIIIRTSQSLDAKGKANIKADCRVYFRLRDKFLHFATKAFQRTLGRVIEKRLLTFVDCARKIAEQIAVSPKKVLTALEELKESAKLRADFKRRFLS
jgi:hypothetical protein